jgi:hypothetical protein
MVGWEVGITIVGWKIGGAVVGVAWPADTGVSDGLFGDGYAPGVPESGAAVGTMAISVNPGCTIVGGSVAMRVTTGGTPTIVDCTLAIVPIIRGVVVAAAVGADAGLAKITATKIAIPKKPTAPIRMSESRVSRIVTVFSVSSSGSWSGELNDASCTASENVIAAAILPHRDGYTQ